MGIPWVPGVDGSEAGEGGSLGAFGNVSLARALFSSRGGATLRAPEPLFWSGALRVRAILF